MKNFVSAVGSVEIEQEYMYLIFTIYSEHWRLERFIRSSS